MSQPLVDYFRCREDLLVDAAVGGAPSASGYFRFGDAVCYGRQAVVPASPHAHGPLGDVRPHASPAADRLVLPFDLSEVVANLLLERYRQPRPPLLRRLSRRPAARSAYYFLRPALPLRIRKHLQRLYLRGWQQIAFPRWPVDVTVETLLKSVLALAMEERGLDGLPFVWFWPQGARGCVMVTHDVEAPVGASRVRELMEVDAGFGIPSSFNVVPESRHSREVVERCRHRGFEVNIHDFNHDGRLFRNRELFERRAVAIRRYASEFGCRGFRAAVMYRRQDWLPSLDILFDMSVPNVAHLEPQQGGCCTVMPHFVGEVLELPLTTAEDYTLFHVLRDYSTALWKEQIRLILANRGLVSVNVHPDYLAGKREWAVYTSLLEDLVRLRETHGLWMAPPSSIDRWWRARRAMSVSSDGQRVTGPASEMASVGWAAPDAAHLGCELEPLPAGRPACGEDGLPSAEARVRG
jgi:hypothetical protein